MRFTDVNGQVECTKDKNVSLLSECCRWCPNCQEKLWPRTPHFHIHGQKMVPACSLKCLMILKRDMKAGIVIPLTDLIYGTDLIYVNSRRMANGLLESEYVV